MRNHIYFFGNDTYGQILCKKAPEGISELISPMRAIPVMPYGAVGAHNDHAVQESSDEQLPGKKMEKEHQEKWCQAQNFEPTKKGQPVFAVFKNV